MKRVFMEVKTVAKWAAGCWLNCRSSDPSLLWLP